MHIHIMPIDKFTLDYIEFINNHYSEEKHFFYIYNCGIDFEIPNYRNVQIVSYLSDEIDLKKIKDKKDKIIVHSLLYSCAIKFLYFNQPKIDFDRVILVVWGGEIYNNFLKKGELNLSEKNIEIMKGVLLKKIKSFMTFASYDFNFMKKNYGISGKQYDCLYPSSVNRSFLDSIECSNSDKTKIQLGNSATFTNQHIKALELLKKYRDNNIEIICPLSYGDIEYRDVVIQYGKQNFGNSFKPLLDYLKPEEYIKMLSSVKIAIFNNNRQQATANIEIMSYLGKKIFIRNDTSMWQHYVIRDKCAFESVDNIKNFSFEQFVFNSKGNIEKNKRYFKLIWDENYIMKLWDEVLNL